jgi:riboflavin biosynthesis pyrimidine reductase
VVVSGSGNLDLAASGLSRPDVPVVVLTTERGLAALPAAAVSERVNLLSAGDEQIETSAIVGQLGGLGARLVVCEGGPRLLAQLLADDVIDELFLTIAPQVAGRAAGKARLGLVEDHAFSVSGAPWSALVSVRRAENHLFLRYRFDHGKDATA